MRTQRLLVGVLGAALLGATPAALTSTSADAVVVVASEVNGSYYPAPDGNDIWRYGQTIKFDADVKVPCDDTDTSPYDCSPVDEAGDTLALQRRMWGFATWRKARSNRRAHLMTGVIPAPVNPAIP